MSFVYGKIKDMSFIPSNRREYFSFLEKYDGKDVVLKRHIAQRSGAQNDWYWSEWGPLGLVSSHTGHTKDELHRLFKGLFLPKRVMRVGDRDYSMSGSTTDLNKAQFSEYIERIRSFAADIGVSIPDPKKKSDQSKFEYPMEELNPTF